MQTRRWERKPETQHRTGETRARGCQCNTIHLSAAARGVTEISGVAYLSPLFFSSNCCVPHFNSGIHPPTQPRHLTTMRSPLHGEE